MPFQRLFHLETAALELFGSERPRAPAPSEVDREALALPIAVARGLGAGRTTLLAGGRFGRGLAAGRRFPERADRGLAQMFSGRRAFGSIVTHGFGLAILRPWTSGFAVGAAGFIHNPALDSAPGAQFGGIEMPKVSLAFFATGCVYVLVGMTLGMWMGASENFTLAPVHAHLNLIGWATMGLMGAFYALAGDLAPRRLAWVNYGLMTLAVLVMAPSLAKLLLGDKTIVPVLVLSELLAVLGMITFFAAVLVTWARSNSGAARPAKGVGAMMPAE
jgi:hypothetical protein